MLNFHCRYLWKTVIILTLILGFASIYTFNNRLEKATSILSTTKSQNGGEYIHNKEIVIDSLTRTESLSERTSLSHIVKKPLETTSLSYTAEKQLQTTSLPHTAQKPSNDLSAGYTVHKQQDTAFARHLVRNVHLNFIPQFKNPCWVEPFAEKDVYENNTYIKTKDYPKMSKFGNRLRKISWKTGIKIQLDSGYCKAQSCRLRCLPYFMLIGVAKSGTTDISARLNLHPEVHPGINKELYWWSQYRYILNATLGDYSDLFEKSTKLLQEEYVENNQSNHVIAEFTSMTFFDISHWREDPENYDKRAPVVTSPHDIKAVLPNVKLIVILRNPTNRLYSSFKMFRKGSSPQTFHKYVLGSIWWWKKCLETLPEENCAYGSPPEMPSVYDRIGNPSKWWPSSKNYSGEIRHGMYSIHIQQWLPVFMNQLLILKMEEYGKDLEKAYTEQIFPFLDLTPLEPGPVLDNIKHKAPSYKRKYSAMLNETREILNDFYRPFNEKLAQILKDDKWLWSE